MGILFQSIKTPLINLLGKKQSLFVNEDGTIVLTKERKIFKKITEEVMHCNEIRFITDISGSMQKIFGRHILYFGHKQQMEAHYLSAEEVAEFKNIVVKLGADIETAGDTTTCYTLLSPSSWIFKREKITIGEDSISYSNKKETTKVKFEEIQYAWIGSGPWYRVGKQVVFCGEQNICPKYNVHIDKLTDIIKNNIKVPLITGTECRSNIFWRIFHPFTKNPSIYLLSDGIAIFGSVGFKKLLYNEVDTYNINRKHFYSWNGDVYIKGVVNNIRKDQSGQSLIISQKGVGRCSWNKLKQAIKNNK